MVLHLFVSWWRRAQDLDTRVLKDINILKKDNRQFESEQKTFITHDKPNKSAILGLLISQFQFTVIWGHAHLMGSFSKRKESFRLQLLPRLFVLILHIAMRHLPRPTQSVVFFHTNHWFSIWNWGRQKVKQFWWSSDPPWTSQFIQDQNLPAEAESSSRGKAQTASGRETHSLEDWKRNVLGMHVPGFWFPVKWAVMSRLGMGLKIIRTASPLANLVTFPWVTFQIGKSVIRMRKTTDLELDILVSHWLPHNASIKTNKQKVGDYPNGGFALRKDPIVCAYYIWPPDHFPRDWGLGNQ